MIEVTLDTPMLIGSVTVLIGLTTLVSKMFDRGDSKRAKIYKRIEDERKDIEDRYVTAKVCDVRSGNMEKKLDEISKDVKTILRNGRNGK